MTQTTGSESIFVGDMPVGSTARVISIDPGNRAGKRLMEMGVIPGVLIKVIKAAPFGDPIEIKVRGYSLALRKSEAAAIEVAKEENDLV